MEHQDWEPVVWRKESKHDTSTRNINHNKPGTKTFLALDSDDPTAPKRIGHTLRITIQSARQAKKMTQKELAIKINVPQGTITDYENGKVIPNSQILSKMSRILGVKLPAK
jgi:putative transcription factor